MKFSSAVVLVLALVSCAAASAVPEKARYYYGRYPKYGYGGGGQRVTSGSGEIEVHNAGRPGTYSSTLSAYGVNYVCPDDYDSGFTLVCKIKYEKAPVKFYVDGRLKRTENYAPYTIAGDNTDTGRFVAWRSYGKRGGVREVSCSDGSGKSVSVEIEFVCDKVEPTPDDDDMGMDEDHDDD